jgi:hypothetical protein
VVCHTDDVATPTTPWRRLVALLPILTALMIGATSGLMGPVGAAAASTSPSASTTRPSTPLRAPKTSYAQDTKFFTDVTEADPTLVSYEQKQGNVALRALLTDGSAFCALLTRGGGLDAALVQEATGAESAESQTHLPWSVTTFNTIEGVALLTLCPSELHLLPASARTKITRLGKSLAHRPG